MNIPIHSNHVDPTEPYSIQLPISFLPDAQNHTDLNPRVSRSARIALASIPEAARDAANCNLDIWNLDEDQYNLICEWYADNRSTLENLEEPAHFHRTQTQLPFSVIYVPKGPQKGLHVRSKVKIGIGSFNTATRMLHLDTGKRVIARSASVNQIGQNELKSNNRYAEIDPDGKYFATGTILKHKGYWRPRGRASREAREAVAKEWSDKITIIMDEQTRGNLYEKIMQKNLTYPQMVEIAYRLTRAVALAHENRLVETDYKPENVFLDEYFLPRMGDFCSTWEPGSKVVTPDPCSNPTCRTGSFITSPLYWPPEYVLKTSRTYVIEEPHQIWIHGLVIAEIFRLEPLMRYFDSLMGDCYYRYRYELKPSFDQSISHCLPEKDVKGSIHWIVSECLKYYPEDRIRADELIPYFERLREEINS